MALAVTLFFSCKNNFKEVQKIGVSANEPQGEAEGINAKRTDSGRVSANLISPKMLDFGNRAFGYSEFPEGITLYVYDDQNEKSTIISDYCHTLQGNGLNRFARQCDSVYSYKRYALCKTTLFRSKKEMDIHEPIGNIQIPRLHYAWWWLRFRQGFYSYGSSGNKWTVCSIGIGN